MSVFGGLVLTNRGRNLQAKVQAGTQLKYTGVKLGDGALGTSNIADLTALKNTVLSLPISKLKVMTGGRATIGFILKNNDLTSGFYFRELGVFAQDPDLGEILYCYGNAANLAEYIPAGGGADIVEKTVDLEILTGNASSVSAVIDNSLVFETPEGAQAKADAAEANAKNASTPIETFNAHSADDAIDAHNASNISVADTNNRFTGTNVEAVLDELFTFANSVKTNVSGAIGSPATVNDTGATLAGYINTEKGRIASNVGDGASSDSLKYLVDCLNARLDELATNVNAKGVTATSADTLAQLTTKVSQIPKGAKIKSVQRGLVTLAQNTANTTIPITAVDLTKSYVKITYKTTALYNDSFYIKGYLLDATNLRLARYTAAAPIDVAWEVIEFESGVKVQSGNYSGSALNPSFTITAVNMAKSFLLFSHAASYNSGDTSYETMRGYINTSTNIVFNRTAANGVIDLSWFVVEFLD